MIDSRSFVLCRAKTQNTVSFTSFGEFLHLKLFFNQYLFFCYILGLGNSPKLGKLVF